MLITITVLIAGILIGVVIASAIFYQSKVGTLRIDVSDPIDGPYLFLEVDKGVDDIASKLYVLLKVNCDSYLPRN